MKSQNTKIKRFKILAVLAFLSQFTILLGEEPIMRKELNELLKKRETAIKLEIKPLETIHDQYTLALKGCKTTAQSEGDLDAILAANTALEAQDRSRTIGVSSDNPKVSAIQQTYKDAHVNMLKQIDARMVSINRDYHNQLEKLVKKLTQAGMINDALEVRKIKDEIVEQIKAQKAANVQNQEAWGNISTAGSKETRASTERDFEIAKDVKIRMCWIPPGEFMMGAPLSEVGRKDSETQHSVKLTKGFWMAKTELTQAQWEKVTGSNPSYFKGNNLPVEQISWNDVCGNSTRTGGFLAMINTRAPNGWRFDIPTEAEWEYASRAGSKEALYSGYEITAPIGKCRRLDDIVWYKDNSHQKTHPVGKKKANAWGLHDTLGNLWEWCADGYCNYTSASATDPITPVNGEDGYVICRGACFGSEPEECRSAKRGWLRRYEKFAYYGVRLVLRIKE